MVQHVKAVVTSRAHSPGIRVVTMASPPANALSPAVLAGLDAALDDAVAAADTKVLLIVSALDGIFAAGADVKHLGTVDAASFTAYGDRIRAVNDRLAAAPFLSIAAIDGLALGGGVELAMAATMRVAGPRAALGMPEVRLGLIPGSGGTQRLPRLVGRSRAIDMLLTARHVGADEAHTIGLVDRVTGGDAEQAALALAHDLIGPSLPAQLAAVRTVNAAGDLPLADGQLYEIAQEQLLLEHGEAAEGITAFLEKRRPRFR